MVKTQSHQIQNLKKHWKI